MHQEKLFFNAVKEDRDWYFVEYNPPVPSYPFASLNLVVSGPSSTEQVAAAMEVELKQWLARYPVPLMVAAFDENGGLCHLSGVRSSDFLFGYLDKITHEVKSYWHQVNDNEIPHDALDFGYLRRVYSNVGYKTSTDLRREDEKRSRLVRIAWWIVFVWAVVVPALIAVLEWAGPLWLAALALIYSLWKALIKALKILGWWDKSPREVEKDEEELRMRHHHYHCERNPESFIRLKLENFERSDRELIRTEATVLKQKKG